MSPAPLSGWQVRDARFHSGRESEFACHTHLPLSALNAEDGGAPWLGLLLSLPEPGAGTGSGLRAAPQLPGSHRLRCPQLNPTGKVKPTTERDDLVKIEICLRTVTGENRFSPVLCRLPSPSKKCLGNSNHSKRNNHRTSIRGPGPGRQIPATATAATRGQDRDRKGRLGVDRTGQDMIPAPPASPIMESRQRPLPPLKAAPAGSTGEPWGRRQGSGMGSR